jgi:hypothetical protein
VGEMKKYTVLTLSTVGLSRPKTWRVPVKWNMQTKLLLDTVLTLSTVGLSRPKTWRVPVKWIQNSNESYCGTFRDLECFFKEE